MWLELGLSLVLGLVLINLYFGIAKNYGIVDKPNKRSSHVEPTLRGGGILFPLMFLVVNGYFLTKGEKGVSPWILAGVFLVGLISFWDDVKTLPARMRILVHLLAVGLCFWQTGILDLSVLTIVIGLILVIGSMNAYNFMDGINGITVLYSMVAVGTLHYLLPNMHLEYVFVSLLVFGFYNLRKKAVCFSGDVGSVTISYIIAFCICSLMMQTYKIQWILLLGVYGIDAVVTILYRINRKENIFNPHRTHLYQYLANEKGMSHLSVSVIYAVAQLMLNVVLIQWGFTMGIACFVFLAVVYLVVRVRLKLD